LRPRWATQYDGGMHTEIFQSTLMRRRARGGIFLKFLLMLAVIAVLIAAYLFLVLNWSYSAGDRSGYLQKFSYKGWLCKTWEGELAITTVPGVAPVIWPFSVRDAQVAEQIRAAIGRRVALHYTEHRGIPTSCFGETGYFVDAVRTVVE
jgi:hypothetical protein